MVTRQVALFHTASVLPLVKAIAVVVTVLTLLGYHEA